MKKGFIMTNEFGGIREVEESTSTRTEGNFLPKTPEIAYPNQPEMVILSDELGKEGFQNFKQVKKESPLLADAILEELKSRDQGANARLF